MHNNPTAEVSMDRTRSTSERIAEQNSSVGSDLVADLVSGYMPYDLHVSS